jgi:hypothetical protein
VHGPDDKRMRIDGRRARMAVTTFEMHNERAT